MTENTYNNLSKMVKDLKTADTKYAGIVKGLQIIYWIIIPMYFLITVDHILGKEPVIVILGSSCMLLGLLIFAFFMRYAYKTYSKVDYSLPTLLMLKKAAYRYQLFQLNSIWAFLALLLVVFGLAFKLHSEFNFWHTFMWFLLFIAVSIIGGLIWWYVRYKPLRDGAIGLIKEIEEELE